MRRLAKILVTATFATALVGFAFAGSANAAAPSAGSSPATHMSVTETAAQTQAAGWTFYRTYQSFNDCATTGSSLVSSWPNYTAWICQERSLLGGWVYDLYLYQLN